MKIIKATTGQEIKVSDEDYPLLSRHNWYVKKGYPVTSLGTKQIKIHRLVIGKLPPSYVTDHINRDKLDNRRENLRAITSLANCHNSCLTNGSASKGYVGVRSRFRNGKSFFEASSSVHNKDVYIGRSDNEIEAAKMRDAFVYKTRGEFAFLNFPDLAPEYEVFEFKNKKLYKYFK